MNNFEYGKIMIEEGAIKSLSEWDNKREYLYGTMDRKFDYLWYEDEDGVHFVDRLYSSGIMDDRVKQRESAGELRLDFESIDNAIAWLESKEA